MQLCAALFTVLVVLTTCKYDMSFSAFVLTNNVFIFIGDAQGLGLWCYKCVSTHPGCGSRFDWRWYWSYTCPGPNDKCVKIIERKGAEEVITRDCLSSVQAIRRDIPADVYEGCRPAAKDVKLAQYVFNDIDELDIRRYSNLSKCQTAT